MAYATAARAELLYGVAFVTIGCDRDNDGVRDAGVLENWLDVATNEIDGYLAGHEVLPLPTVPPQLEKYCIDMAVYHARSTADVMTEIVEKRYNAALRYLENVQKNKIKLVNSGVAEVNPSGQASTITQTEVSVVTLDSERRWTRDKLDGL